MKKTKKTVLLVGGGTGGHIVPILNVYKMLKLKYPNLTIVTVGGKTKIDKKLYSGFKNHISLRTGKMHRAITLNNLLQFFYLISGTINSLIIIQKYKPDVIFSKAGYVALPIIFWAKIFKIPYFIHESDIVIGKTNKVAALKAEKIFVGFPVKNYPKNISNRTIFVGQILRPEIQKIKDHIFDFGFSKTKSTIFITGGSQGARNINKAIFVLLDQLLETYNLIHHTGSLDYEEAVKIRSKLSKEHKESYFISELLTETEGKNSFLSAIAQSRLVISRSSATTLGEVAALKKPIITIPYKHAASDHQTKNALFFSNAKAAIVLNDDKIHAELVGEISRLMDNPSLMKQMAENAYSLLPRNGLDRVVDEIAKSLDYKYEEV